MVTDMECWTKRTTLEKKSFVGIVIILLILAILITLIFIFTEESYCRTAPCIKASHHILASLDFQQNPCENFYNFACGASKHSFSHGKTKGSKNTLKNLILEEQNDNESKSLKLQKQFYHSCLDLEAIETDNSSAFWALIKEIGGWPAVIGNNWEEESFDVVELMVALRKIGLQYNWFLDVSPIAKGIIQVTIPENVDKIDDKLQLNFVNLMTEVAVTFGAYQHVAFLEMREVLYFQQKFAKLIDEVRQEIEKSELQKRTLKQVQTLWQKINWIEFLNQITNQKLSEDQLVVFSVEEYLPKLNKLLRETSPRTQVNYIIWRLVQEYAAYLPKKIRELVANYRKLSKTQYELWYKNREEFCYGQAKILFPYALEAAFLRKYVNQDIRDNVEEMILRIEAEMEKHLLESSWMDEETKKAAVRKLQNISFIIGGPEELYYVEQFDKFIGVEKMDFTSNNIIKIRNEITVKSLDSAFENPQEHNHIKNYFYELVPSQEVKFLRDYNLLYIPAGVLEEFFFDLNRPNYLNYGIIGTIIGHELVHGFDTGTFGQVQWWSNQTSENFEEAIQCFLHNCTEGHAQIDCRETVLENLADSTGINLSYEAYYQRVLERGEEVTLPGLHFTPLQLFWIAYASIRCDLSDVPPYRIISSFRNSDHFAKDFACELGSNMSPLHKCQIL